MNYIKTIFGSIGSFLTGKDVVRTYTESGRVSMGKGLTIPVLLLLPVLWHGSCSLSPVELQQQCYKDLHAAFKTMLKPSLSLLSE